VPDIPLGQWVSDFIDWLLATVPWLFDAISAVMQVLVDGLTDALATPPPVVWVVVFTLVALLVRGWGLALYTVLAFLLVVSLELWVETMQTLALVLVAAVIATAIGVPIGILAARNRAVSVVVRPVLDSMQTTPVFVYLIPAVFFFGVGVVPGVVATILFAIPPGVRLTELGIRQVDREVVEAAHAFGARPGQILREVQLPLALPSIMAGVNQVIMLALSMVVTAGLLGAAGLGAVVVRAVTQLDVASGFEGGLAVVLLAGSGWGWYLGQVAEATVNRTDAIPGDGNDGNGGPEAMNLLLVGNDSRANLTAEQQDALKTGGDSGINTDTMILVHIPADGSRASFVSFPRDSYVAIPGYGMDKLNAAYAYGYAETSESASESQRQAGGAQLLVKTISSLTGLQIDHYAEVDLLGFFNLSSVVGGVEVNLCKPVDDRKYSGAVFPAGVQTISGADALEFVRQRHGLPRGDFDRIVRQQVFMAGVLRKMLSDEVMLDLGKQRELVGAASQSLTIDQGLDLFQLAEQMQSVTAGSIEFQTIPHLGTDRDEQDRSIIRLEDEDTLHQFFAQLSAEPEAPAEATAQATPAQASSPGVLA